jgi:phage baseplate assembly protein V
MSHEHVYDGRSVIREATVLAVNDAGAVQTVDVLTAEDGVYAGVPVIQPWGHASSPPLKGLKALLFGVGGDPANLRALLYSTGRRLGGLSNGESVTYANNGARVAFLQGGTVQVQAGTVVDIVAPNVTITASGGATLNVPIEINGSLTVGGAVQINGTVSIDGDLHVSGSYPH